MAYVERLNYNTGSVVTSDVRTLDDSGNETLAGKLTVGAGPTNAMDVATKQYVDNQGGGGASDWEDLENKPFEEIGDGLEVDSDGRLNAPGTIITNLVQFLNISDVTVTDAAAEPVYELILSNDVLRGPTVVAGRNQINVNTDVSGYYIDGSGIIRTSTTVTDSYSQLIPCTPGDTVYAYAITSSTVNTRAVNKRLHCYDSNGTWIRQLGVAPIPANTSSYPYEITGTIPNNCVYLRLSHATDETEVMLEFGSKTQYEPFNGSTPFLKTTDIEYDFNDSTYNVPIPSALSSGFYQAEVDVLNGLFTVSWDCIESYNGETLPGEWESSYSVDYGQSSPSTGAQVFYELATPVVYNITPNLLSTSRGSNSVAATPNAIIKTFTYSSTSIKQDTLIANSKLVIGRTGLTENQLRRLLQLIN